MMGLAKEYSGKRVIDGLSLDVEKGEIFISQLPWALKMALYLLPLTHCSMCLRAAALETAFPGGLFWQCQLFFWPFPWEALPFSEGQAYREADKKRFDPALILPTNADRIGQRGITKMIGAAFYPLMNLSQPA